MKYNKKITKQLCKLLERGECSILDACHQASISKQTYYRWKSSKPEFAAAIQEAEVKRFEAQKEMALLGLVKLLTGFEYDEITIIYHNDKQGTPVVKSQKRVRKFMMPNPAAVIFTLTNLDSENWKNMRNTDVTSKGDKARGQNSFLKLLMEVPKKNNSEPSS